MQIDHPQRSARRSASAVKKEDDVVLLLYVVSLSTDVALLGRYAVGDLSASPMLDHIMLRPNGSPAGTAGNGHSLVRRDEWKAVCIVLLRHLCRL